MPTESWTTKTELNVGTLGGDGVLVGTETEPILSIFEQDILSVDTDVHLTYTGFTLSSDFVPANNQVPGIATEFDLQTDFVPANNQTPSISLGDISSFKSTGDFDVLKSDMKITWVT